MKIRPANGEDGLSLASIHACAFDAPWTVTTIAALLADGFAFVAEEGEGPCAFVLCRAAAGEAEILTLAVAPASRRRGFGRALITAAFAEARSRGARRMFLEVARSNAAALALYDKARFRLVGERRGYYGASSQDADALVLRRDL